MSAGSGLAITALGMVSALGRDVVTSCAAARAGLAQATELKSLDFASEALFGDESLSGPPIIFGHVARGSGDGFAGVGKALVQGGAALDDLLKQRPLSDRERARTGLVLNVSDYSVEDHDSKKRAENASPSVRWKSLTQLLPQRLAESRGLALSLGQQLIHHGGHAGGAASLAEAMSRIKKGEVDRCIVGAVDARTEPAFLKAAARLFQLRTVDNPVGLSPGEAAAFYLVERESDAAHTGYAPIARIVGTATSQEPTHLLEEEKAPTGTALAEVIVGALASFANGAGSPVRPWILGDHNGSSRRAVEWANALVRLRATQPFEADNVWFPAMSFGDVGAACGPVAVCCVGRAFARGYAKTNEALIWLSSESGAKGAIALRRPAST